MVEDLEQFRLFEGGNGLARLVVIHEDDLEARRVQHIPLSGDAEIQPVLVHHPVVVILIAQELVEHVADVRVRRIFRHGGVRGVPALGRHHLAHGRIGADGLDRFRLAGAGFLLTHEHHDIECPYRKSA